MKRLEEFRRETLDKVLHVDLTREDVFRTVYTSVEYVVGSAVEGHIAEFGVMTGRTACALAMGMVAFERRYRASDDWQDKRQLHLFDSFEGLPASRSEVDVASPHVMTGVWKPGACKGIDREALQRNLVTLLPDTRIRIHAGWFADTLPKLPEGTKFALVHIDSDLYESARTVLDHLFSRDMVADGAMLLFDDWDCNRASPKFGERRAFAEAVEKFGLRVSDCGRYGFASRRFIVHLG